MRSKRILALIMAALMVSATAAGCKPGDETSSTAEPGSSSDGTSATEEFVPTDGSYPVVDLDGYEFVVADCTHYGDYELYPEGTSLYWDAFWENKRQVEEDLNCTISYKFYDPVSNFDTIFPELMSGNKISDIQYSPIHTLGAYISADMVADLSALPGVDMNAKYWNQAMTKACTIDGKIYATSNDLVYHGDRLGGLFYNRTLINKLGMEDPYDLVKKDQWTFDKFREMALAATRDNGDGVWTSDDIYGLVSTNTGPNFYYAGGNRVLQEVDGKMKFMMNTPQSLETIRFIQDILYNDGVFYHLTADEHWTNWHKMLANGHALFLSCTASETEYMREGTDVYGWVPTPKGPHATDYAAPIEWNSAIMYILKTNTDLDKTGPVIEALAYLGHKMHEAAIEEMYEVRFNGDEKSIEMLELTVEKQVFDIFLTLVVPEARSVYDQCLNAQTNDPASIIQSNEQTVQIAVDEVFNNA